MSQELGRPRDRHEHAIMSRMDEEERLAGLSPVQRNIERIDAEIKRRVDSMRNNIFARAEEAEVIESLSRSLAALSKGAP